MSSRPASLGYRVGLRQESRAESKVRKTLGKSSKINIRGKKNWQRGKPDTLTHVPHTPHPQPRPARTGWSHCCRCRGMPECLKVTSPQLIINFILTESVHQEANPAKMAPQKIYSWDVKSPILRITPSFQRLKTSPCSAVFQP